MFLNSKYGDNSAREVDVFHVAEVASTGSHVILDVRELDEWQDGHIHGAIHIPLAELSGRVEELPADQPIYTICHSGVRSLYAIDILEAVGRTGAKSLAGGMVAWERAGNPVER